MGARRITLITAIALAVIAAAAVSLGAEEPQVSPDRVLKGTTPTITITLDKANKNWEVIKGVRVAGRAAEAPARATEGRLAVVLPRMDIVGTVDVEVTGKDDTPVKVGQLTYVDSTAPPSGGLGLLLLYVVLIVLPPVAFILYDMTRSYKERAKALKGVRSEPTVDQVRALLETLDQGPTGFTGLTRSIVAVTLIMVIAIAIFHIVVFAPQVPRVAEQLLTLLAGTLAAITGFYFGTKATAPSESGASKPGAGGASAPPAAPAISVTDLLQTTPGGQVTVKGTGFGAKRGKGSVTFNDQPVTVVSDDDWTDTAIKVAAPAGLSDPVRVVVTNDEGKASEVKEVTIKKE